MEGDSAGRNVKDFISDMIYFCEFGRDGKIVGRAFI
jgi:hypothetical protein